MSETLGLIFPRFRYPSGDFPLGIATLAAFVREQLGMEVVVCDTTFDPRLERIAALVERPAFEPVRALAPESEGRPQSGPGIRGNNTNNSAATGSACSTSAPAPRSAKRDFRVDCGWLASRKQAVISHVETPK